MAKTIVVYRIGSMGDFLFSMPALYFIREQFPHDRIVLLTNLPIDGGVKAVSPDTILAGSGLIDGYVDYSIRDKGLGGLLRLFRRIRALKSAELVYLMPRRSRAQLWRDWLFFRLCGMSRIHGLHFDEQSQQHERLSEDLYESEAQRLMRTLSDFGTTPTLQAYNHGMRLGDADRAAARTLIPADFPRHYLVACIGSKAEVKDWGEDRWTEFLRRIAGRLPQLGLIMIGSADEAALCDRLAGTWQGRTLNLCGRAAPRVSAAVLADALLFVGHDSGPMHMASAVNRPVLAIFSARDKPGLWFPTNPRAEILYKNVDCMGCQLENGCPNGKKCIRGITVDEVEQGFWRLYEQYVVNPVSSESSQTDLAGA